MSPTFPQKVMRFCPKCGSTEFKYNRDNSFLCGICSFHLYINSAAAVAGLILNSEGELLLTRRAIEPQLGTLDLPGGFVDILETAENAMLREIKEELNLNINKMTYFMSFPNEYVFGGLSVFTTDLAFICKIDSFESIQAKDDISAYEFYKPEAIPLEEIGSKSMKEIVKAFVNSIINESNNKS